MIHAQHMSSSQKTGNGAAEHHGDDHNFPDLDSRGLGSLQIQPDTLDFITNHSPFKQKLNQDAENHCDDNRRRKLCLIHQLRNPHRFGKSGRLRHALSRFL